MFLLLIISFDSLILGFVLSRINHNIIFFNLTEGSGFSGSSGVIRLDSSYSEHSVLKRLNFNMWLILVGMC